MGDRCYVEMTVRKCDAERLDLFDKDGGYDAPFGLEEDPATEVIVVNEERREVAYPGAVYLTVEEANYGYWDDLQKWAKAGAIFYGTSATGAAYGPTAFVSSGDGKLHQLETGFEGGYVVYGLEGTGAGLMAELRSIRKYLDIRKAVISVLHHTSEVIL